MASASNTSESPTNNSMAAAAKAEGLQAFKAGDHSRAASLFLRALDLGGEVHTLRSNRAAALSALGDHAAALADADAALAASTVGFEHKAHYRRAVALDALKRPGEALAACERGLLADGGADHPQLLALREKTRAAHRAGGVTGATTARSPRSRRRPSPRRRRSRRTVPP